MPSAVLPMPGVPISRGVSGRSFSSTTSQQASSCLRISPWPIHWLSKSCGWLRWSLNAVDFNVAVHREYRDGGRGTHGALERKPRVGSQLRLRLHYVYR